MSNTHDEVMTILHTAVCGGIALEEKSHQEIISLACNYFVDLSIDDPVSLLIQEMIERMIQLSTDVDYLKNMLETGVPQKMNVDETMKLVSGAVSSEGILRLQFKDDNK